ncbi:integral membrane protein [Bordetella pertussis]|nr:TRAP transporter large permease [Bordetella pertussis]ALX19866.1 membrane protein [Bordetella pertussis]ALX23466.1 membrane protein [Bordetella pertussis]AMS50011.1 membrane protein [Bordetella pertussis]AMS53491.1 membrane protein [Bordetella pertussis]AMS57117.1 membrane protein [Bordetella pertussis]
MLLLISFFCIALFILGTPMVLLLAVWVAATSYWVIDYPLMSMGLTSIDSLKNYTFLAVPLFIATGDLLTAGGVSQQLIKFSRAVIRAVPGRTAATSVLASGMFCAISGSSAAAAATMGKLMAPEFKRAQIPMRRGGATVAAGGILGGLIPPSTIIIIYSLTVNVSPVELNLAAILPGILILLFIFFVSIMRTRQYEPASKSTDGYFKEVGTSVLGATPAFIAIALLFVGLYSGLFSPTEAAGVVTIYCAVIGLYWSSQFGIRDIPKILMESASVTGIIGPIVVFSIQFQQILSVMEIPDLILVQLVELSSAYGATVTLAVMMGIVLLFGTFMEVIAVILILAPIFAPIATEIGMNGVHWGMIFIIGASIGFISPPHGLNLFITSMTMKIDYGELMAEIVRMIIPILVAWLIVAAFPYISLVFV